MQGHVSKADKGVQKKKNHTESVECESGGGTQEQSYLPKHATTLGWVSASRFRGVKIAQASKHFGELYDGILLRDSTHPVVEWEAAFLVVGVLNSGMWVE